MMGERVIEQDLEHTLSRICMG